MKRYILYILALLLASACSSETNIPDSGPQELLLNVTLAGYIAEADIETKVSDNLSYETFFTEGDEIGVIAIDVYNGTSYHAGYKLQGGKWKRIASTALLPVDNAMIYWAHYPYFPTSTWDEISDPFSSHIPEADQSSYENYAKSDWMEANVSLNGQALSIEFRHFYPLIELELPAGATSPTLTVSNLDGVHTYIPWNISGQTYRCIAHGYTPSDVHGTYVYENTIFEWGPMNVNTQSAKYVRINLNNTTILTPVKVEYTDGSFETVVSGTTSNRIQYTPNTGKVIKQIERNGQIFYVGRSTSSGPICMNFNVNDDLEFRPADPDGYIPIGSFAEFQLINTSTTTLAGQYKLEADLDLLGPAVEWTAIGTSSTNRFEGTFDGNGKSIDNLFIDNNDNNQGLFGYIYDRSVITNVHIKSGSVTGNNYVGGIAGNTDGSITSCSNAADITGNRYVGGIIGWSQTGFAIVTACYNTGVIKGDRRVGGIAGASNGQIFACYNTGSIEGNEEVGGVVGDLSLFPMAGCYNIGSVTGNLHVGGIAGYNVSSIAACYWLDLPGDDATSGSGSQSSNQNLRLFGDGTSGTGWPAGTVTHLQWGTGDGSGDGKYWQSLGGWGLGYPKLWFESP